MIVIVMGVSASGKTEVGELLAPLIGGEFLDADDFHSPENKHKMESRVPLTDEDRAPWLATLRRLIEERLDRETPMVLACSALKREYRYQLRVDQRKVVLAYLKGSVDGIAKRIQEREHEYFRGLDMLVSQLCTLEEPLQWENALVLDRTKEWSANAAEIKAHYKL
ncbi:MAG: AAA family ATPase [Cytophagales bacterium]|nr:AAA family ATPase [Armatimonadota bacterium]